MLLRFLPILGLYLIGAGCSSPPVSPQALFFQDQYVITIPEEPAKPVSISYTASAPTRFILPFHYADNPVDTLYSPTVSNLIIIDAEGNLVDTASSTEFVGPVINTVISVPHSTVYPLTLSYTLDFSVFTRDSLNKDMPRIFRNDAALFFTGAHTLIIPEISSSLTSLWRTAHPARIIINHPQNLQVYGVPADTFTCATIYELLFLQLSHSNNIVCKGLGGGVSFVIIDMLNKPWAAGLGDSVARVFSATLDNLSKVYGVFSDTAAGSHPYTVAIHSMWGAQEGYFGFAIREPVEGTDGRFGEICAHEALHHCIGIRCGEYDDPWWKEAAAAYLGVETAVSAGTYDKESFKFRLTQRFYGADSLRFQRPLSDPWLRQNMFTGVLYTLAYDRGGQVMMLLDDKIRTGSQNRFTLHHAIADLCRRFSGTAFSRDDFMETLERFGAESVPELFALYVDRPDTVPSTATLTAAFNRIDSLAVW